MKRPRWLLGPYKPLDRPRFPVSRELVSKQLRAAEKCPVNGIRPLLVESQPDTFRPLPQMDEGV